MHQLERELWLSEVLQKHKSSIIFSFIFIHSVMSENDKKVPLIIRDFHTKRGMWDTLSVFKRGDFKVSHLKFREW